MTLTDYLLLPRAEQPYYPTDIDWAYVLSRAGFGTVFVAVPYLITDNQTSYWFVMATAAWLGFMGRGLRIRNLYIEFRDVLVDHMDTTNDLFALIKKQTTLIDEQQFALERVIRERDQYLAYINEATGSSFAPTELPN